MRVKVRKANNHFGGGGGRLGNGDKEASSGGSPKIKSYRMSSLPRGLALIVEIQEYDNNVMDTRHGSQVQLITRSLKLSNIEPGWYLNGMTVQVVLGAAGQRSIQS